MLLCSNYAIAKSSVKSAAANTQQAAYNSRALHLTADESSVWTFWSILNLESTVPGNLTPYMAGKQAFIASNESVVLGKEFKALTRKQALENYSGALGTAPKNITITATGSAIQQTPNSTQGYLFFTQTLSNQIYYEVRLWAAYNYMSQNPIFPNVSVSSIQNPPGWGASGFLGYNFHPCDLMDITPFYRFDYYDNMTIVYEDNMGNYIHSKAWGSYLGIKLVFQELRYSSPFINIWTGIQQIALTGNLQDGPSPNIVQNAIVNQIISNVQIGLNLKVSSYISLIPYWQYQTVANYPDNLAAAVPQNGGFGISSLTNTQQIIGMKFSVAW